MNTQHARLYIYVLSHPVEPLSCLTLVSNTKQFWRKKIMQINNYTTARCHFTCSSHIYVSEDNRQHVWLNFNNICRSACLFSIPIHKAATVSSMYRFKHMSTATAIAPTNATPLKSILRDYKRHASVRCMIQCRA